MEFKNFNLDDKLIEVLNKNGYITPTRIQEIVIPKALKNENIIVKSPTGSGKTHSFLIPIFNNLEINKKVQAIIVSPTRELAKQIYDFAISLNEYKNPTIKLFTGGLETKRNVKSASNSCEILIATPGRLSFLIKNALIELNDVKTIVLDEADMLFDSGFLTTIEEIFNNLTNKVQIEVFSATINKNVELFLKKYIESDEIVILDEDEITSKTVRHHFVNTKHIERNEAVLKFLKIKNPYLILIFANSKKDAYEIYTYLSQNKYKCGFINGDLSFRERKSMLKRVNNNKFQIVVCTDIASRGLDINDVTDILSVDLPNNLEYYYHRAGRTGRNFKDGDSYVFYDSDRTKLCQKLIDDGLKPDFLKLTNEGLVQDKPISNKKKTYKNIDQSLEKDIKIAISQNKSKNVKPGYKKKVKKAVQKVKNAHRRQKIKNEVRKQLNEKFRNQ